MNDALSAERFYVPPVGSKELAESLPAMAFWDPSVLDHERETVLRNSWLCVPKQLLRVHNPDVRSIWARPSPGHGYSDLLGMRGNAARIRVLGESIFLYRGTVPKGDPELRCFRNMCPHMRYPLLEVTQEAGNETRITCEQHGLLCSEDGTLISHPAFSNPTDEQKARLSLIRYHSQEWFDFYFICRGDPAVSFDDAIRPVLDSLSCMPLEHFKYQNIGHEQRIVDGNWKTHSMNYEDWLHIRYIHKRPNGLADALDPSTAHMELYEHSTLMWAYASDPADGFDPRFLPERFQDPENPTKRVFALWWFVFPNLTLNFYPWGLSVNIYMPAMVDTDKMNFDPEKTEFLWYHYVWDQEKYENRESRWLMTLVDFEDIETIRPNKGSFFDT